jgi:ribosome biogenesis GTPase / thiamine phosphate phosphatase
VNREERKLRKHFAQHALGVAVRKQRQKDARLRRALETPIVRERIDPRQLDGWDELDLPHREPMQRRSRGAVLPRAELGADPGRTWMYDGVALGLAGDRLRVWRHGGEQVARVAGHRFAEPIAPGDEVALEERSGLLCVAAVAPRRSRLIRPDPHIGARPRVLAANVDLVIAVMPAGPRPPRPGIVDRILLAAARSDVEVAVCLSKVDLASEAEADRFLAQFRELAIACVACSALRGDGLEALLQSLQGRRAVLVGHSGGGKTSLVNVLRPGAALPTGPLREHDGRGRHTTSAAAMVELPGGGQLLDTPGVRQFGCWEIGRGDLLRHFADIARLARDCRFRNCIHRDEPDCAVIEAVGVGNLAVARWAAFQRLAAEVLRE